MKKKKQTETLKKSRKQKQQEKSVKEQFEEMLNVPHEATLLEYAIFESHLA